MYPITALKCMKPTLRTIGEIDRFLMVVGNFEALLIINEQVYKICRNIIALKIIFAVD